MKQPILILACALLSPLAFAQTNPTEEENPATQPVPKKVETTATASAQSSPTEEENPVTEPSPKKAEATATASGTVLAFAADEMLVLKTTADDPMTFVLGQTAYQDKAGNEIASAMVKEGTQVQVTYRLEWGTDGRPPCRGLRVSGSATRSRLVLDVRRKRRQALGLAAVRAVQLHLGNKPEIHGPKSCRFGRGITRLLSGARITPPATHWSKRINCPDRPWAALRSAEFVIVEHPDGDYPIDNSEATPLRLTLGAQDHDYRDC